MPEENKTKPVIAAEGAAGPDIEWHYTKDNKKNTDYNPWMDYDKVLDNQIKTLNQQVAIQKKTLTAYEAYGIGGQGIHHKLHANPPAWKFYSPPQPSPLAPWDIPESPLQAENTMTTNSKKAKAQELVDNYPKDQTKATLIKDRICVVLGTHPQGHDTGAYWHWRNPYWVSHLGVMGFDANFVCNSLDDKFCPMDTMGITSSNIWYPIEWLEKNGYALIESSMGRRYYHPISDCFTFYRTGHKDKKYLAPNSAVKHYKLCPVTSKIYPSGEFQPYTNANGEQAQISHEAYGMGKHKIHSCHGCGYYHEEPFIFANPNDGSAWICKKCSNKQKEKEVIRGYDDSNFLPPMPDFLDFRLKGKMVRKAGLRLFGIEAELGFNQGEKVEVAFDVWDTMGHDFCYLKHDGSIVNSKKNDGTPNHGAMKMGFEIVTAPAGINVHRERWKQLAKCKFFHLLRSWDTKVCGFHVHVSRESLTMMQIGRILVFMNHPNNRYFIEVVAGRGQDSYTTYIKKDLTDCDKQDDSKYMAVRTNKPLTIEFRIFRGTINYRHMIRNIEFVDAVCDFCAPCQSSNQDMYDFRKFIGFVGTRKALYPFLAEWLEGIDMIAKKPLRKAHEAAPIKGPVDEVMSDAVKEQLRGVLGLAKSAKPIDLALKELVADTKSQEVEKKTAKTFLVTTAEEVEAEQESDNF